MVHELGTAAVAAGDVRDDVPPDKLVTYRLHSIAAAGGLASNAAVRRLVSVTLADLRPPPKSSRL
jgi:hypothetical protein